MNCLRLKPEVRSKQGTPALAEPWGTLHIVAKLLQVGLAKADFFVS